MDFQSWLVEEIRGIRSDCQQIGRLDERLKAFCERLEALETGVERLERRIEESDTPPKGYVLAQAAPEPPSKLKSAAVNISTAGLGGSILWVLQKLFGP